KRRSPWFVFDTKRPVVLQVELPVSGDESEEHSSQSSITPTETVHTFCEIRYAVLLYAIVSYAIPYWKRNCDYLTSSGSGRKLIRDGSVLLLDEGEAGP